MTTKLTSRRRHTRPLRGDDTVPPLGMSRTFSPGAVDLDDLAEVLRHLIGSGNGDGDDSRRDPNLHSQRRRASHVMGNEVVEAPGS